LENFTITTNVNTSGAKIVVIGIGGAGQNMIEELTKTSVLEHIKLVAANADAQALKSSNAPYKIQLGPKTTKGLGCGMKPEVGKASALESYNEIKQVLLDL